MTELPSTGFDARVLPEEGVTSHRQSLALLVLGALGVVYGDIGTSPLYAFREALAASSEGGSSSLDAREVLGLLSLIVWALTIIVTVKYVGFVLRADNKGEGGTLSLMALARAALTGRPGWVLVLGIIGGALFFGDAIITPAISVLSAVEGLEVVAPRLASWVLPLTVMILIALFAVQRFGTGGVSSVFGPITALWFVTLGISGLSHIVEAPQVISALNPVFGVNFLFNHPGIALLIAGSVFLAVTGAEALYVDLGHFGRKPIIVAWFALVFPSLLLNYFGQGAFVLTHPEGAENPFFMMQPDWALLPMVLLATAATVIASQAVISGAYSLARQAMHLGLVPRLEVRHTSAAQSGQIYLPQVNTLLLISVLALVVIFQNSSSLSAAYGIAVTGEMLVTVILLTIVIWKIWRWRLWLALLVVIPLGLIDLGFFVANLAKFAQGGWIPALVAAVLATLVFTWVSGRARLTEKIRRHERPLQKLLEDLERRPPITVPGTAVFLTSEEHGAPSSLLHSLKHYKALHEHNVLLSVTTSASPRVPDEQKIKIYSYNKQFSRVIVTFGFMETPNIPKALALARKFGWKFDIMRTSFFLSRRSLRPSQEGGMPYWQDRLFIALSRNARDATEHFHIPTGLVVEIGTQVTI